MPDYQSSYNFGQISWTIWFLQWDQLRISGFYGEINYTFTFCTINVFDCFCDVMTQFELVKHKFLNKKFHIDLCGFQIT